MTRGVRLALWALGGLVVAAIAACQSSAARPYRFTVGERIVGSAPLRLGINTGVWTSWGAAQLSANVIKNPGFEGLVDRAIAIAAAASTGRMSDDQDWLARPDGFWRGARFSVRTGVSAGVEGGVSGSVRQADDGLPGLTFDRPVQLARGDVVALTRIDDLGLPAMWWIPSGSAGRVATVPGRRTGGAGARVLRLLAGPGEDTEIFSYLDAIGDRAGKLLPVAGRWTLRFWARREHGGSQLEASFRRQQSPPFLKQTVALTSEWREYHFEFTGPDAGPDKLLELSFRTSGSGSIELDDVDLRSMADAGSAYRKPAVDALEALRPGILRDWAGQLGDTLENRLARPETRRCSRYRPFGPSGDQSSESDWFLSLPEFVSLCRRIGARPWIVISPAYSDSECEALGAWLRSEAVQDSYVEFGNENWNMLFRPAGIPDLAHHAEAANRCFERVKHGAGGAVRMTAVVNGQGIAPDRSAETLKRATQADALALAPYLLPELNAHLALPARLALLRDEARRPVLPAVGELSGRAEAIYEVNLHTLGGTASAEERNPLTAGMPGAAAVAWKMLAALEGGVAAQCFYTLAQFDSKLDANGGFVRIWGAARDLAGAVRLRPAGQTLALLNQVLPGERLEVRAARADEPLRVWAFQSSGKVTLAAVSLMDHSVDVEIDLKGVSLYTPQARGLSGTNEDEEQIGPRPLPADWSGDRLRFQLPGWSVAVVAPREPPSSGTPAEPRR